MRVPRFLVCISLPRPPNRLWDLVFFIFTFLFPLVSLVNLCHQSSSFLLCFRLCPLPSILLFFLFLFLSILSLFSFFLTCPTLSVTQIPSTFLISSFQHSFSRYKAYSSSPSSFPFTFSPVSRFRLSWSAKPVPCPAVLKLRVQTETHLVEAVIMVRLWYESCPASLCLSPSLCKHAAYCLFVIFLFLS